MNMEAMKDNKSGGNLIAWTVRYLAAATVISAALIMAAYYAIQSEMVVFSTREVMLRGTAFTLALLLLMIMMCMPMAVWLISVYRRLCCGSFTKEQAKSYSYKQVRHKVIIAFAVCTLIAFLGSYFALALDNVFIQTSRGTSTLREYAKRLDEDAERYAARWEESRERYTEDAVRLASLINADPDILSEKWLRGASENIGADYIMIFDENGDELITDSQYRNISLKERENPDMADFSRLLNGVETISHANVEDEVTGLKRDYHGVCLRNLYGEGKYGALLIAVDPEEEDGILLRDEDAVAAEMAPEDGFIIGVDPESRKIVSGSIKALIGARLKEADISDSYLGYIRLKDMKYFALSMSQGELYRYYGVEKAKVMKPVMPFALCFTLMLMVIYGILSAFLLKRYPNGQDDGEFNEQREKLDKLTAFIQKVAEKNSRLLTLDEEKLKRKISMENFDSTVTPEQEAFSIFQLLLFMLTAGIGVIILLRNSIFAGESTVFEFIYSGKWPHGINLFSFSAILFLLCLLLIILFILKAVYAMLEPVLSKRALTISSLVMNILFYASVIAFVLISLGYLGVNTKALLASAGFVGLALSMGFRDIVSDVLSGIMIITGRTFEVGDYIEIRDAGSGTVKSIGLMKTELISESGKTFSIRNSHISKVTNVKRESL